MTPLVEQLISQAFERAPLTEANSAIDGVRERRAIARGDAVSYEIALPQAHADGFLTTKALPKLVYFLDCRGERPPNTPYTFVSLFTPNSLFFIEAGAVVMTLGAKLALAPAELVRRYGATGAGDPKLLGV